MGASLDETRRLQRKHAQLEQEMRQQQQSLLGAALKQCKKLVEQRHFAHVQLAAKHAELELKWDTLKQMSAARSARLDEAVEVHKYLAEVDELVEWLGEKQTEVANADLGKDDRAALSNMKWLQALMSDLSANQQAKCNGLGQLAARLQSRMNDAASRKSIARRQAELENTLVRLVESGLEREQHIASMLKVFEYERECDATLNWLKVTGNNNYRKRPQVLFLNIFPVLHYQNPCFI